MSSESLMFVKENPNRKKNQTKKPSVFMFAIGQEAFLESFQSWLVVFSGEAIFSIQKS